MRGVPAQGGGGTRHVAFHRPRSSTPSRPKNTTSRDPFPSPPRVGSLPPFEPGTPPPSGRDLPHLFRKGERGRGSRLGRGPGSWFSRTVGSLTPLLARGFLRLWAVWAWEYHEPGPLSSRDPLPLLILFRLFGPPRLEEPGRLFSDIFWDSGPQDPSSSSARSQICFSIKNSSSLANWNLSVFISDRKVMQRITCIETDNKSLWEEEIRHLT